MKIFECLALLSSQVSLTAVQHGLVVPTQQGDVSGTLSAPIVRQFLGIPYATVKRWEAPQPPPRRSGLFHATSFGPSCPQAFTPANVEYLVLTGNQMSNLNVSQSELDCLSINVWSPTVERKQSTSVMIWIYGGGLAWGTSNISVYDGTNIVRDNEDVTIVSFNYRLNIFGQPNAPQLLNKTGSQNFALLDIDAAVQWVHDNIANFGGDPNRITLFGQSAGALAADAYLFSHPHDTMVKGVIQQSGNQVSVLGSVIPTIPLNSTAWNAVAEIVGCGSATTPEQFSCMQAAPFQRLEDAVINIDIPFPITVDNITIFSDIWERATTGNFLRVPVLGGSTAHEFDIFVVAQQILARGFAEPVLTELISDIKTLPFTCKIGTSLMNNINAGVPAWRYQYQAIIPGISTRTDLRAYHSAEIPMVFGTYNLTTSRANQTEIALSKYVQQAWVAFARDPERGLLDFGWPVYSPDTMSVVQLGNIANSAGMVLAQGTMLDASCVHADVFSSVLAQLFALL